MSEKQDGKNGTLMFQGDPELRPETKKVGSGFNCSVGRGASEEVVPLVKVSCLWVSLGELRHGAFGTHMPSIFFN